MDARWQDHDDAGDDGPPWRADNAHAEERRNGRGFVKSLAGRANYKLVDARAPVFYNGTAPSFNAAMGHIPGAISIPFSEITDNSQLIDREHVAALFQAAGVKQGDTVVAYCHVGQQATAVVFAARLLGYPVMLYDGSFQDWVFNARGPVEK